MEIILREAIEKLGHAGDVVTVKDGYARNYLLPRELAYQSTPGNLKMMELEKEKYVRHEAEQREEAEKLRELLNVVEIRVERRVGERDVLYGSVTSADIAEALDEKGLTVDKRKILINEPIKQIGESNIRIRLFTDVIAEVKLRIEPEGMPRATTEASPSTDSPETSEEVSEESANDATSE